MAKYWYEKWSIKTNEVTHNTVTNEEVQGYITYFKFQTGTNGLKYTTNGTHDMLLQNRVFLYPLVAHNAAATNSDYKIVISSKAGNVPNLTFGGTVYRLEYVKNALIETIVADESEYPANGIQGDYWYIRGEKAFPSLKINGQTICGAKIKDSTGQVRTVRNVYYKDSSGIVRNLK
ncbi:hypothetical protein [Microaceticoccus formicicus]|uniref:hypothetical protein n=1 Tax=Microaceticoccus formicicus TaxID=3118105 RepID=UPI003CD01424|nr:hypothetical protein VZL98_01725 [Peptoniphilaceae bacterium AMB_02]